MGARAVLYNGAMAMGSTTTQRNESNNIRIHARTGGGGAPRAHADLLQRMGRAASIPCHACPVAASCRLALRVMPMGCPVGGGSVV